MNPKVSVIVPVYKAEEYLSRCIDSILSQSFHDFEVLLINDGSPDMSGVICDEYKKRDIRIRVFHQENKGVTGARKKGVEEANGKWIFFIDSDDTISKDALELLYESAMQSKSDYVIGNYRYVDENLKPLYNIINQISSNNSIGVIKEVLRGFCSGNLCGRLIEKSLFTNLDYPPRNINIGEDIICGIQLLANSNNITICPHIIYNYVQQPSSVMHNLSGSTVVNMPIFIKWIHHFIKTHYPSLEKESSIFCMKNYYLYLINGGVFCKDDFLFIYTDEFKLNRRTRCLFYCYKNNIILGNLIKNAMRMMKFIKQKL